MPLIDTEKDLRTELDALKANRELDRQSQQLSTEKEALSRQVLFFRRAAKALFQRFSEDLLSLQKIFHADPTDPTALQSIWKGPASTSTLSIVPLHRDQLLDERPTSPYGFLTGRQVAQVRSRTALCYNNSAHCVISAQNNLAQSGGRPFTLALCLRAE